MAVALHGHGQPELLWRGIDKIGMSTSVWSRTQTRHTTQGETLFGDVFFVVLGRRGRLFVLLRDDFASRREWLLKGKRRYFLYRTHTHNVCTHPIHAVRREGCRLQGGRRQKNQRRHSRRPVRRWIVANCGASLLFFVRVSTRIFAAQLFAGRINLRA